MTAAFARLALCATLGLGGFLLPAAVEARTQAQTQARTQAQAQGRIFDLASGAGIADAEVTWLPAPGAAGSAAPGAEGSPARAPRRTSVRTNAVGVLAPDDTWGPGGGIEVSALGYLSRRLAWAEATEAGWRIGLERDPLALDEIVVTASSLPRLRSQIAVPMETVEAEEIEAAGVASADGLLAELPGVQVTAGTPVGSNLMIRGIGGARVLVLLDGQPSAGALLENRDLSRMSLAGVERVEIVKGPLSSLYGSDALGGVVNVITQLPASGFQVDARALSGGAGRREAEATASGGGRLRYRITGGWRQQDRIPGLADGGPSAFARVWDFRSRLQFKASDAWDILATATYLRERQRWPVGGAFSGFNDNAGFSGSLEARRPLGPGAWSGSLFLQEYEHLFRSARGDAPIADGGADTQWERLSKGAAGYSAVLGGHSVDVGIEVASRAIRSPDKLIEERAADRQLALFAQDAWRLGGTVVSGGARLTWNDRWGSNLSPTVGLTRRAGEHVHFRAAVARGFRAPSFKELAWNFVNVGGGYVLQGFPDLDPERSWNVSGGVDGRGALRASAGCRGASHGRRADHRNGSRRERREDRHAGAVRGHRPADLRRSRARAQARGGRRQPVRCSSGGLAGGDRTEAADGAGRRGAVRTLSRRVRPRGCQLNRSNRPPPPRGSRPASRTIRDPPIPRRRAHPRHPGRSRRCRRPRPASARSPSTESLR